ncbi:hypothetical protein H8D57_03935 [bacterium]|nr:hypothetical protein [bacterium]
MIDSQIKLTIDGQVRDHHLPDTAFFSQVMDSVNRTTAKQGMVIGKIRLNGLDITGADWSEYMPLTARDIIDLEIETIKASTLAVETIQSLDEFISDLNGELTRTAELFRLGSLLKANNIYTQILDGIQIIVFTTRKILSNLELETDKILTNNLTIKKHLASFDDVLTQMLDSQQNSDWIFLSDQIEYELIPCLKDRQLILRKLNEVYHDR